MKATIIGAGPAGLSAASRLRSQGWSVCVLDGRHHDDMPGWGITLPNEVMNNLPDLAVTTWNEAVVYVNGLRTLWPWGQLRGVSRGSLVQGLQKVAIDSGVSFEFGTRLSSSDIPHLAADCDLLIGADGASSVVRTHLNQHIEWRQQVGKNTLIWLGLDEPLPGLWFGFIEMYGGVFIGNGYPYSEEMSTFIVECTPIAWEQSTLKKHMRPDRTITADGLELLNGIFSGGLSGTLQGAACRWTHPNVIMNQHICYENIALIGDAAGTTYYSFGAGTPMALNSAHTLSVAIKQNGTIDTALQQYAAHHLPTLHAIQKASLRDQAAMEHLESLQPLHPASFAYAFANRFEDMNPGTVPD